MTTIILAVIFAPAVGFALAVIVRELYELARAKRAVRKFEIQYRQHCEDQAK
jgi:hypothetical protein